MIKKNSLYFILATFCFAIFLSTCSKDETNSATVFNLRMTDGPLADVQQVNIDLQRIVVTTNDGRDSFDLGTNAGIYNLLDYQGGLDTLIGSAIILSETIHQVRLVLGSENSIMVDSVLYDLKTPSAQQSGLKVNVHENVAAIDTFNLLIDFDAEESVVEQGNGQYHLKPVIRVVD